MWSHVKLGSFLLSLIFSGCALPEGGGQAGIVENKILSGTGGAVAQSAKSNPPASGGSSATGGATNYGTASAAGGGVTKSTSSGGVCADTTDAGFDGTCLCAEDGGSNTVIPHGSAFVSQLDANKGDICSSSFLSVISSGQIMGVPSYFDEGDRILSLGAVTSLFGIRPVSFKLAIYSSDANGQPAANLFTTPDIIPTESATTAPPEYKLPSCIRISSSGTYWLMILPNGEVNIDCIKVYTDNMTIPDGNFYSANHVAAFQPESSWLSTFTPYTPCKSRLPYLGANLHLFAMLISGRR